MTTDKKVAPRKLSLLELASDLGSVSPGPGCTVGSLEALSCVTVALKT
jgi:hypothetical protein